MLIAKSDLIVRLMIGASVIATITAASPTQPKNTNTEFNFHNYDAIKDKSEKNFAASRDINAAFPAGTPTQSVIKYMKAQGGFCQKREYIPPQDRMSMSGDHIYCEFDYGIPESIIVRAKWAVDIKYKKDDDTVQELKAFWSLYGIGG